MDEENNINISIGGASGKNRECCMLSLGSSNYRNKGRMF